MHGRDALKALYLESDASIEEVKRAYRELARLLHPDQGGNTARFQQLQQVYEAALAHVEVRNGQTPSQRIQPEPTPEPPAREPPPQYQQPPPPPPRYAQSGPAPPPQQEQVPPGDPMLGTEKLALAFFLGLPAWGIIGEALKDLISNTVAVAVPCILLGGAILCAVIAAIQRPPGPE